MSDTQLAKNNEFFFELDGSNFKEQVENLEKLLKNSGSPDVFIGNSDSAPLAHSFSDGVYIREILLLKGIFAIGKIHKLHHTFFLMKGKLRVCTEQGVEDIEAPYYGTSIAGVKRVVFALEDSVFVNVLPNPSNTKDIDKLEDTFVVSSYKEYEEYKLLNE